ncbi:hypothetical protein BKA62DRAFT_685541 [Auriculariales sp. MPI-PUGE-AT-0066]|nr:hypothetical protein BKA62DRAFT_685541 [Auriculariales sp. MPI-PUGE-AT-0066]
MPDPAVSGTSLIKIYEKTWLEHYAQTNWEAEKTLRSLAPPLTQLTLDQVVEAHEDGFVDPGLARHIILKDNDLGNLVLFDKQQLKQTIQRIRIQAISQRPGPAYLAVDAYFETIFLGEQERLDYPRVLPFPDEPVFRRDFHKAFLFEHGPVNPEKDTPALQDEWLSTFQETRPFAPFDPELEEIEQRAVTVLWERQQRPGQHITPAMFLKAVESSAVLLSHSAFSNRSRHGLFAQRSTRSGDRKLVDASQHIAKKDEHSVLNQFLKMEQSWCSRLSCTHGFCSAHPANDAPQLRAHRQSATTSVQLDEMTVTATPCGFECFLIKEGPDDDIVWDNDTDSELMLQVTVCPDLIPCELAALLGTPCWEVSTKRKALESFDAYHPEVNGPFVPPAPRPKDNGAPLVLASQADLAGRTLNAPCSHEGTCTGNLCICARNEGLCSRNCCCVESCQRKWRGCTCRRQNRRKICSTTRCDSNSCHNSSAWNSREYECFVAAGTFGFGLYATSKIPKGAFIGLYQGEMLKSRRAEVQELLSEYTHRNYLFAHQTAEDGAADMEDNPKPGQPSTRLLPAWGKGWQWHTTVDAADVGNHTRFANHPKNTPNTTVECASRDRFDNSFDAAHRPIG